MFNWTKVALGSGYLHRFTIFELKRFFSIYFHVFNTVEQDRFHTHAFNGIAIVLRGSYEEEFIENGTVKTRLVGLGIRYIPRSYNHRLLQSTKNAMSILFAGPWAPTWTEENEHFVRTLTWGRQELHRTYKETQQ